MLIGVGPALLVLSTGIYHLFSAGWIRPPPILSHLGASLIGWASERDEWLKQRHIPEYVLMFTVNSSVLTVLLDIKAGTH